MPHKANQKSSLGRALIKDRFGKKKLDTYEYIHEAKLDRENDHEDRFKSVTERSSLDDFLATAEMAGREFTAERLNVHFVDSNQKGLISDAEKLRINTQNKFENLVSIPRRPTWKETMTKQELLSNENESFLAWRRQLAEIEEKNEVLFTPYEKNLDFWRQLWRVIERSDVIVQIVDARNPLMFRCKDLETYVKQVDPSKKNILLVNKADYLSINQRQAWLKYFVGIGLEVVFWSAMSENEKLDADKKKNEDASSNDQSDDPEHEDDRSDGDQLDDVTNEKFQFSSSQSDVAMQKQGRSVPTNSQPRQSLLTREELINYFKKSVVKKSIVIGMVGYPNVGKSSTINTLLGLKKVPVSATPGRTKHFQTLIIDEELCLCDCPGLVFPSFALSKSDMILNGILPVDQMRDYVGPVNLLSHRIPRNVIEGTYGINIKRPGEGEDPDRPPTAAEILSAHALNRGFMTSKGQPDNSRSARIVLKDYVNGRLLYSVPPPDFDPDLYKSWTTSKVEMVLNTLARNLDVSEELHAVAARINRVNKNQVAPANELDKEFFRPHEVKVMTKGKASLVFTKGKKPRNKKKEKARRVRTIQYK